MTDCAHRGAIVRKVAGSSDSDSSSGRGRASGGRKLT